MIRVCLVEDQTLVREGLESLLALTPDIKVIANACDGEQARTVIPNCNADVVLLDVRMPKMSGIELLRCAQGKGFPPSILLTTFDDDLALLEGIRLGAKGYLLKDVSLAQLTEAIRVVAGGGTLINPAVTERLLRGLEHAPLAANNDYPNEALTDRETEVLRLMTGGYSNREIASAMNLSEGTVKNHVSNILGKLGVRDRTRAVLKAIERGYI
jgi:DNA-binding NarL/FixJ family response regulator